MNLCSAGFYCTSVVSDFGGCKRPASGTVYIYVLINIFYILKVDKHIKK